MVSGSSEIKSQQTRLDTWKSIAHYLDRSSRTVQRWHAIYGLPVHHLSGESGSVYAYPDDLDNWLRGRGRGEGLEVTKVSHIDPARSTDFSNEASQRQDDLWDSALISNQSRARSAQMVILAAKMWESVSHRNLTRILEQYREAIDLNPGSAAAFAGLSVGLIAQGVWGLVSPPVAYASATAAFEDAIEIDPELPLAKCAGAWLKMVATRDWPGARRSFDEVVKDTPSCANSMNGRGLLYIAEGRLQEASALFLEGAQQRPLSSDSMTLHCWSEYLAGEFAYVLHRVHEVRATGRPWPVLNAIEALAAVQQDDRKARVRRVERLAAESPQNDVLQGVLGYAYAANGQVHNARKILEAMVNRANGRMSHEPYAIALILIGLNETQRAIDCLEQSYRNGSLWSLGFGCDPILKSLRDDPRYKQFLSACSYPQPQLADAGLLNR